MISYSKYIFKLKLTMERTILNKKLAIIGAGPVGYTLSMLLAQKGYQIDLFEKRDDPLKQVQGYFCRSLNILLNNKVVEAWSRIDGVLEAIRAESVKIRYLKYHLD